MKLIKNTLLVLVLSFTISSTMGQDVSANKKKSKSTVLASTEKKRAVLHSVINLIDAVHYSPKKLDDKFSADVFERFLERLDYGKAYFTAEDIKLFETHKKKIDDQLKKADPEFYFVVKNVLDQRQAQVRKYYDELITAPYKFDVKERIQLDGKAVKWAKNDSELYDRWRKTVKYRILAKYVELAQEQADKKDTVKDWVVMDDAKLIDSARKSVQKNMDVYFKRLDKNGDDEYFTMYVTSIANTIEPHTDFFAPKDKEKFDERMSGTFYGIGAQLQSKEGVCYVTAIITGSPCWKQGKLKVDDKILKVGQGSDEPDDINNWDLDDIVSKIRGPKGTEVRLYVKHKEGNEEVISIIRDEVHQEDVFAKSLLIDDAKKKIGYIYLPEFYADFNRKEGKRCYVDIKNEITKLNNENIDGLILDLRNNGGGSLYDVVEINSYFQGRSAAVQVKSKDAAAEPLYSKNSTKLYDKPLVILINGYSASASEILAGALQDYNRAIIIGSTSFGKGTVQRVLDLDEYYKTNPIRESEAYASLNNLGALKTTLQKFYRVSGNSTQLKGVEPDIKLPELYMYLNEGERKDKFALPWDTTTKLEYTTSENAKKAKALANSAERVKNNDYFKLIEERAKQIKEQQDDNQYSLELNEYKAELQKSKDFAKKIEELDKIKDLLDVYNCKEDMDRVMENETSKKKNEDWIKLIKKDATIKEAVEVLKDLI